LITTCFASWPLMQPIINIIVIVQPPQEEEKRDILLTSDGYPI